MHIELLCCTFGAIMRAKTGFDCRVEMLFNAAQLHKESPLKRFAPGPGTLKVTQGHGKWSDSIGHNYISCY